MPVSASGRLNNPLARRSSKSGLSPRDCPGGSAGDGKSPRKVRRGTTAHTLYVLNGDVPPYSIMEKEP